MISAARCAAPRVVLLAAAAVVYSALGINVPCDSGTRVYSLSAFHGSWLDGIEIVCTGGGQEYIPPDYNLEVGDGQGGGSSDAICAGTAGVESIEWSQVSLTGVLPYSTTEVVVNATITCADGSAQTVADDDTYYDAIAQATASCDEGEYVYGMSYEIDEAGSTTSSDGSFAYAVTDIGVLCRSTTLDEICTADMCSGGVALKEELPDYCEAATCTEAECCDTTSDDGDDVETEIIAGVVSSVAAAMIIGAGAWTWQKCRVREKERKVREDAP
ncbi:unnamed protein product [Ectocarpus sp. 4 AP-2014]